MIVRIASVALLVALASAIATADGLQTPIVASVIMVPAALVAGLLVPSSLLDRLAKVLTPVAIAILAAPIFWMILQAVPVPVRSWGNPIWATASAALNEPLAERVTVDIRATVLALAQYTAIVATGLVTAMAALDRQRAVYFLYVLLGIATFASAISLLPWAMELRNELAPTIANGDVVPVLGTLLSCAVILRELDEVSYLRQSRRVPMRPNWIFLIAVVSLLVCLAALVLRDNFTIFIAALLGAELLLAVTIIRKWFLGIWGSAGVLAAAALVSVAFFSAIPAKRNTDLTIALATQGQSATERMLQDTSPAGFGAGTFDSLLPIYRDVGKDSLRERPTDAAAIAIGMGRLFFCGLLVVVAVSAWTLVKRSLSRRRDYVYPAVGAAALVSLAVVSVSTGGVMDLGPSLLVAGLFGLAFGRSITGAAREPTSSPQQELPPNNDRQRQQRRSILPAQMGHRVVVISLAVALLSQTAWLLVDRRYSGGALPISASHFLRALMPKASSTASAWGENSIDASPAPAGFSTDDPLSTRSLVAGDPSALHLLTTTLHGSPLRGDLWLRLAAVSVETDRSSYDTAGLLKMSYYTAPNDLELFPLRLSVALSRDALVRNIELRDLIKRDIEVILTRQRALTPALMAAYRSASADGKIFAENLMAALDVDHSQQKQMPHEELGER